MKRMVVGIVTNRRMLLGLGFRLHEDTTQAGKSEATDLEPRHQTRSNPTLIIIIITIIIIVLLLICSSVYVC